MPRRSASNGGDSRKSRKDVTEAAAAAARGQAQAPGAVQATLPSEEEEKRVPATGDAKQVHGDESSAVSQQILNFLLGLKTLKREGLESRQELEQALYAKRFELLFPEGELRGEDSPQDSSELVVAPAAAPPSAVAPRPPLPQFHALPQQQLLKEFLMSGKLLGGHQSVAHVLYPDAVHWPHQLGAASTEEDEATKHDLGTTGSDLGERPNTTERGRRQSMETREEDSSSASDGLEEEKVEVVLCGKRVQSTVRGRALKDVLPEKTLVPRSPKGVQPLPEARFQAAQEARKHLERAVKMEEYQERRIAERIQSLQIALDDEMFHQEELRKRQKRREVRQQELKKDLERQIAQKMETERAQREEEKRQKELEKKEKERLERYYKAQKEKVEQWQAEMSSDDFFSGHTERARRKRMVQEKEMMLNALADLERRNENPPLKRLEVEAKLQEQEECLEHRPFVAPKAHDQPRPILQMIAESKVKAKPSAVPSRGAWKKEAEGVSKRYGLSAENLRNIESQLQRTAQRFRPRPEPRAEVPSGG